VQSEVGVGTTFTFTLPVATEGYQAALRPTDRHEAHEAHEAQEDTSGI
jgi:hypothetical protein